MKFYEVIAKCGHVGKGYFYKGVFFISAESGREAAGIVRSMPRVKHDKKDAILAVTEISLADYRIGKSEYHSNPFFRCSNSQEQMRITDIIESQIFEEDKKVEKNKKTHSLRNVWNHDPLYNEIKHWKCVGL